MNMKTSDAGIYAIALHEGIVPAPYFDSVNVKTYGIGHTAAAGAPDPAKMARGMPANLDAALADVVDLFRRDVTKYEAAVNRAVKVPITQAQFDALVSFHYNTGAIGRASFVKKLNAGDVAGAAAGMMAWSKPKEIIPRRKAEQALFAKGTYPTGQVTVWGVDKTGRVIWKPVLRLTKAQVLALIDGQSTGHPATAPKRPAQAQKPAPVSTIKETGKAAGGGLLGGGVALAVVALWQDITGFFAGIAAKWDAFWIAAFSLFN